MYSEEQEPQTTRPFRVCESCGQLTPTGSAQCAYCGAVSMQAVAQIQAGEERRFLEDLFTRAAPITPIIVGINIAIYLLLTIAAGGEFGRTLIYGADPSTALAFGAQSNALLRDGEWFRLITAAFVHFGLVHLMLNSYSLWMIGPLVERLYGSSRFLLLYLLTAIGGGLASFVKHEFQGDLLVVGAGASTAIFGLCGIVAVFSYKYRRDLPPNFTRRLKSGILPSIAINLLIGYSLEFVDNSAHIGGLLTGAVLALLIPYIPANNQRRVSLIGLAVLAFCVMAVFTSFAFAYRRSGTHLAHRIGKVKPLLDQLLVADQAMVNVFRAAGQNEAWKPSPRDIAQLTDAADALEKTAAPDVKTEQLRQELLRLVREQREIIGSEGKQPPAERLDANGEAFLKFRRNYEDWIKTEGPKYGLRFKEASDQKNGSKEQPKK